MEISYLVIAEPWHFGDIGNPVIEGGRTPRASWPSRIPLSARKRVFRPRSRTKIPVIRALPGQRLCPSRVFIQGQNVILRGWAWIPPVGYAHRRPGFHSFRPVSIAVQGNLSLLSGFGSCNTLTRGSGSEDVHFRTDAELYRRCPRSHPILQWETRSAWPHCVVFP